MKKEFIRIKFSFDDESRCKENIECYLEMVTEIAKKLFIKNNPDKNIPDNFKPNFIVEKLNNEYIISKYVRKSN